MGTTGNAMTNRFAVLLRIAALVLLAGLTVGARKAEAQEIQITGPLAGAPAWHSGRLHRAGRFEIAPNISFTLLDEYQHNIMPGLKLTYHINDWFGVGVWGGYGIQYTTGLSDELQTKAIDDRGCAANPSQKACQLTAVSLTHKRREPRRRSAGSVSMDRSSPADVRSLPRKDRAFQRSLPRH